jgi:hypothetical protein
MYILALALVAFDDIITIMAPQHSTCSIIYLYIMYIYYPLIYTQKHELTPIQGLVFLMLNIEFCNQTTDVFPEFSIPVLVASISRRI